MRLLVGATLSVTTKPNSDLHPLFSPPDDGGDVRRVVVAHRHTKAFYNNANTNVSLTSKPVLVPCRENMDVVVYGVSPVRCGIGVI